MPGFLALAVAMGIGRFAFTPLLPMMQADMSLSVAQSGWLAAANYVGYLVGAVLALRLRIAPGRVVRAGLVAVGAATAAMALPAEIGVQLALRFLAGAASAWVLVFVCAWGFDPPALVFAGVGAGIAATGLACLALFAIGAGSAASWALLGAIALAATAGVWRTFCAASPPRVGGVQPLAWSAASRRLVIAYGAFGFGYIVPATFLPAMARVATDDPALFGWTWPVFGLAATASTFAAARLRTSHRATWIGAQIVMALGVLLAIPWPHAAPATALTLSTLSALLVGATFMVVTMAGMQEARRVAGPGTRTLVAAMTVAFAAGQVVGTLAVSAARGYVLPLLLAAAALSAGAHILGRNP